ncbi:MAG: hypothetical protein LM589_03020 [Thermosphaera sp.]|nr:hypothetical protein [Thermosphaera sp.]
MEYIPLKASTALCPASFHAVSATLPGNTEAAFTFADAVDVVISVGLFIYQYSNNCSENGDYNYSVAVL